MDNNPDMEEGVGLRFRPTEEELIIPYLLKRIHDNKNVDDMIPDIDIHTTPPWHIPSLIIGSSPFQNDPDEVYFFCRIRYMSSSGKKVRKDEFGFWKVTGSVRTVKTRDGKRVIGRKNILVYKKDDDPDDAPTEYRLHEYHLNDDLAKDAPTDTRDFVLCALKRSWDKQAKGRGKRTMSEGIDEETPRAKKGKAKERARKATNRGSPNSTTCPELSPTGCNVVNTAENQIAKETIAEVPTPSDIGSPQSILFSSLPSPNTSPALSPVTCAYIQGDEAPFPNTNEVYTQKPETPYEVCLITGTEIADCRSIEVPHQEPTESGPLLPLANINHFPLHRIERELEAEYEPLYLQYFSTEEPPPHIFPLLDNCSCSVLSNE